MGLLYVFLLLGAVAMAEAVYYLVRSRRDERAEELRRRLRTAPDPGAGAHALRRRRLASSPWLDGILGEFAFAERLEKLLEQTDSGATVAETLLRMLGPALLALVAGLLARRPIEGLLVACALGPLPLVFALRSRAARAKRMSEQLPDALDMLARALRAGHGVVASFKFVEDECDPPIAVEFAKAYEQQNLGLPLDTAMQNMVQRVPGCLDLKLLAISIKIHAETGGNLIEILTKMAETIRERFKFYAKLRAITAEGRASGVVLASLPVVVAVLILFMNPGYLAEMGRGLGRVLLVGGTALWLLGVAWIRQLSKVEY